MEESKHEIIENAAKEAIYDTNKEYGFVRRDWSAYGEEAYTDLGVMPKKIFELLSEHNIGGMGNIRIYEGNYDTRYAKAIFIPYDECTKEQKKQIDEYRKKLNRISTSKSQKYDEPGVITLPVYEQTNVVMDVVSSYQVRKIISGEISEQDFSKAIDSITIPITQRQLAANGLLPKDFRWQQEERAEVSEGEISEADKQMQLTKNDIGRINNFLKFIKSIFRGKGEK